MAALSFPGYHLAPEFLGLHRGVQRGYPQPHTKSVHRPRRGQHSSLPALPTNLVDTLDGQS
jgi:hypothetical protein